MSPKDIHEAEQAIAALRDMLPPLLWSFYEQCIKEGFTEAQAMELARGVLAAVFRLPNSAKGDS